MAQLLKRLGAYSAHRAKPVIAVWLLILTGAVLLGTLAGGTYSVNLSIPGTPAQDLADKLEDELPEAARGTGTILFETDGGEFTEEQQAAITEVMAELESIDGVYSIQDPFTLTQQTADQMAQLEQGEMMLPAAEQQLADSLAQLDSGQEQVDAAQAQLDEQKAQVEAGLAQLPDVPDEQLPPEAAAQKAELDAAMEQITAGQNEIDASQAQIDEGRAQYDEGKQQFDEQKAQFEYGKRLAAVAQNFTVVSEDNTAAIGIVSFDNPDMSIADSTKDAVISTVEEAGLPGLHYYFSQTIATNISSLFGPAEAVGLAIAGLVLILMLRSIWASILPIVTGLLGVGVTVMVAMFASSFITMHEVSPVLGIMLGLAVGIDYSLFVVNRHREQLKRGYRLDDSIALAIGTSGNAVVFAGMTVMVALLALNIVGIPFLGILGNVAALAVLVAVLLSITFTPAFLHLIGYRVLPKKLREQAQSHDEIIDAHETYDDRTDPLPTRHPWLTTAFAVILLGALAIPVMSMRLGLPDGSSESPDSDAYKGYVLMSEKFGPGRNGPLVVAADIPNGSRPEQIQEITLQVAEQISAYDDVDAVVPIGGNDSFTAFQVVVKNGPTEEATQDFVHELRGSSPLDVEGDQINIEVTGITAMQIDVSEKLGDALPIYLSIVVLISFVLLVVVFRSILVPLIATGGFLLSFLAAMGAVVAVYQWGHLGWFFGSQNPGPILSFLPTLMIGILFGLAMDYQLFLATGMREAWSHGRPARRAVVDGLYAGRRVVVAAAIIMFSVFAGFIFAHLSMVRPIGFGLAIGVLLDAFVVRMALMPALMTLLGEKAWWIPAWLDKLLPQVDVEGASLEVGADQHSRGRHSAISSEDQDNA